MATVYHNFRSFETESLAGVANGAPLASSPAHRSSHWSTTVPPLRAPNSLHLLQAATISSPSEHHRHRQQCAAWHRALADHEQTLETRGSQILADREACDAEITQSRALARSIQDLRGRMTAEMQELETWQLQLEHQQEGLTKDKARIKKEKDRLAHERMALDAWDEAVETRVEVVQRREGELQTWQEELEASETVMRREIAAWQEKAAKIEQDGRNLGQLVQCADGDRGGNQSSGSSKKSSVGEWEAMEGEHSTLDQEMAAHKMSPSEASSHAPSLTLVILGREASQEEEEEEEEQDQEEDPRKRRGRPLHNICKISCHH
ncbi:unnamed protein product [Zymoseptoria tritici ST99CH_1E4]|uniref:Uncharacterized protein n=1 Tax=Zymoseptoria tritici ST99CH_1E4 TaxID=1276532 RepID=A0A2H1HA05_ZYMTR|nr:unnamed protein product [Zymoseptoria tritici ST99CH_1E4]